MSLLHEVPYRGQLASNTCVPTCLGMMMAYWDVEVEQRTIDLITYLLGYGHYGVHKKVLKTAHYFGFQSAKMSYVKGNAADAKDLLVKVSEKQPLLVTGRFHHYPELSPEDGHAIVVIGVDIIEGIVYFHDPHHLKAKVEQGAMQNMNVTDFIDKWAMKHSGWILWLKDEIQLI